MVPRAHLPFIHPASFIPFIHLAGTYERILCAACFSRCWEYGRAQDRPNPDSTLVEGQTTEKSGVGGERERDVNNTEDMMEQ